MTARETLRPSSCAQRRLRWWTVKIKSIQPGRIFAELDAWLLSVWAQHIRRRSLVHQVLRSCRPVHNWSIRTSGKKGKDDMIIYVGTGSCRQRTPFITNFLNCKVSSFLYNTGQKYKTSTPPGFEPGIPWFVVRCLIRWGKGPVIADWVFNVN